MLDQLLHPYKFYVTGMSGILFFIFASCEPLSFLSTELVTELQYLYTGQARCIVGCVQNIGPTQLWFARRPAAQALQLYPIQNVIMAGNVLNIRDLFSQYTLVIPEDFALAEIMDPYLGIFVGMSHEKKKGPFEWHIPVYLYICKYPRLTTFKLCTLLSVQLADEIITRSGNRSGHSRLCDFK